MKNIFPNIFELIFPNLFESIRDIKTLKESPRIDNKELVTFTSLLLFDKLGDSVYKSAEKAIYMTLEIVDDAFKRIPIFNNSTLIYVSSSVFKILILIVASSFFNIIYSAREKIFQLREFRKDKTEITNLPEECIGEIRALEKRWQKQNLSDEEIQTNIELFKQDMQIGQQNMKRDKIKHKIWSLTMRIMLQLGQLLSI